VFGVALFVLFLVLIGPVSILYGADSRITDVRDRRSWWPGVRD
jgi:hypothetical protein